MTNCPNSYTAAKAHQKHTKSAPKAHLENTAKMAHQKVKEFSIFEISITGNGVFLTQPSQPQLILMTPVHK